MISLPKTPSLLDVSLGNLKHRRKQYAMLIVGIVLALYFVSAALLAATGIFSTLEEKNKNQYGAYDVAIFGVGDAPVENLVQEGVLKSYSSVEVYGRAAVSSQSEQGTFLLGKMDDSAMELLRYNLKEGRMPSAPGEIALEARALSRLRQGKDLDSKLSLEIQVADGTGFAQESDVFSYTLVGIYFSEMGDYQFDVGSPLPLGVVSPDEPMPAGMQGNNHIFATANVAVDETLKEQLTAFCNQYGIASPQGFAPVRLNQVRAGFNIGNESIMLNLLLVIVGIMLALAACMGIVNAFSSLIANRRRQIGLLRAVGATRRQIRSILMREAFILSLISVPLAMVLAYVSVWGFLMLFSNQFVLAPNVFMLIIIAIAGIGCILLASMLPLRRASNITPMNAIRDMQSIRRLSRKQEIESQTTYQMPKLISRRMDILRPSRRIGISITIILGMMLFSITAHLFIPSALHNAGYQDPSDFSIQTNRTGSDWIEYEWSAPGIPQQDFDDAAALPMVENVQTVKETAVNLIPEKITSYAYGNGYLFENSHLVPESETGKIASYEKAYLDSHKKQYHLVKEQYGYEKDFLDATVLYGLNPNVLKSLQPFVIDGKINLSKLASGEEILLIASDYEVMSQEVSGSLMYYRSYPGENQTHSDESNKVAEFKNDMFKAGDTIDLSLLSTDASQQHDEKTGELILPKDVQRIDQTVKIGAIIDPYAQDSSAFYNLTHIYPGFISTITSLEGVDALGYTSPYGAMHISLTESPEPDMEEYLTNQLSAIASRTSNAQFTSYIKRAQDIRQNSLLMIGIVGALIFLFFVITFNMVNNAVSSRIRSARHAIGTLRAVGATKQEVGAIFFRQIISMFILGGGIGYVLSVVLNEIFNNTAPFKTISSVPAFWEPLLYFALLFLFVYISMRIHIKRITRESIVENIQML